MNAPSTTPSHSIPAAPSPEGARRVLLVDDHPMIRNGLRDLIRQEKDLFVCGEAGDMKGALEAVKACSPELVIVDISLKDSNGLELIEMLHSRHPDLRILAYSMYDEVLYAERTLRAGAGGYIMKKEPSTAVLDAIREVLKGNVYTSPRVANRIIRKFAQQKDQEEENKSPLANLTNRELEVFHLIGEGKTTREIAKDLHLSIKTIETYRENLKRKFNLRNATELVRYAVEMTRTMTDSEASSKNT